MIAYTVILFVRMWVEIYSPISTAQNCLSSSSWGCELKYYRDRNACWTLLSSSSWGCELKWKGGLFPDIDVQSSSSWGCELKFFQSLSYNLQYNRHPLREDVSWNVNETIPNTINAVILFVRMWVEIHIKNFRKNKLLSSSSWGCELKCQTSQQQTKYIFVILFVRMWVEIYTQELLQIQQNCHPLREDVSWNTCTTSLTR